MARARQALVAVLAVVNVAAAESWADKLIRQCGSVGAVLCASSRQLAEACGLDAASAIGAVRELMVEAVRPQLDLRPLLATGQALLDYLHLTMAHRLTESARVLYLNTKNRLIRDEQMSEGSIDHTTIYPREVARHALELGSAAVILVHNHPSGDSTPSRQDIALTRDTIAALKPLGIRVHDHLIIASGGHASMRALGIM